MATRTIIHIDEDLCDGCGQCVDACAEGAIAIVDGKARLVSEIYCDGLGACIGDCPMDAITMVEREARPFDEDAVARHLEASGRTPAHAPPEAVSVGSRCTEGAPLGGGCPGARILEFAPREVPAAPGAAESRPSALRQWPVQLHLVSPHAPYFRGADLLVAADCTAFACGSFHENHLAGRSLVIACPKLDSNQEIYLEKLVALIDEAQVASIKVLVMEVPCCGGLTRMVDLAAKRATREVPITREVVTIR